MAIWRSQPAKRCASTRNLRELLVSGVIRPQDIASDNTVLHDRMAEARISYGGRGQMTEVQTPRYGQQLLDVLLPVLTIVALSLVEEGDPKLSSVSSRWTSPIQA